LRKNINDLPTIFYAVATNNVAIVRLWHEFGADSSAVHGASKTPLLAFAIAHRSKSGKDTTAMLATLLSLGASPKVIPAALYTPYDRDLDPSDDLEPVSLNEPLARWCSVPAQKQLIRSLNLVQRYDLYRATKFDPPSERLRQVAGLRSALPILGMQYFLIGQTIATKLLLEHLSTYLTRGTSEPLVLVFAGPSGHGKTELARQLGAMMSLPLEVVDCTKHNTVEQLHGAPFPYQGYEKGSALNNFVAANAGHRSIVFLDEFEKTNEQVRNSFLVTFEKGEYQDCRTWKLVDCSKTIWIIATNAGDQAISTFCSKSANAQIYCEAETPEKYRLGEKLADSLPAACMAYFSPYLMGRITGFVPFIPFTRGEQAVLTRKFLLELQRKARQRVVLSSEDSSTLFGDVRLRIERDAAVSSTLAKRAYQPTLGSRSLAGEVKKVENRLVGKYLNQGGRIVEGGPLVDYSVEESDGNWFVIQVDQTEK
ncbi:P-loop containing nucleoside triphosphate hydrolase protein, partial [Microdochium bolleyi]